MVPMAPFAKRTAAAATSSVSMARSGEVAAMAATCVIGPVRLWNRSSVWIACVISTPPPSRPSCRDPLARNTRAGATSGSRARPTPAAQAGPRPERPELALGDEPFQQARGGGEAMLQHDAEAQARALHG